MRAAVLLLPFALGCTRAATKTPAMSVRAAWEPTTLGAPRPAGFGVTGGNTVHVSAERRAFVDGWTPGSALVLVADGRAYGFDREGPRTLGFELDVGLGGAYRPAGWPVEFALTGGYGFFRAPLATAIGPMRFLGGRPAFGAAALFTDKSGAQVRLALDVRCYSTVVWEGCSFGPSAGGGWSW